MSRQNKMYDVHIMSGAVKGYVDAVREYLSTFPGFSINVKNYIAMIEEAKYLQKNFSESPEAKKRISKIHDAKKRCEDDITRTFFKVGKMDTSDVVYDRIIKTPDGESVPCKYKAPSKEPGICILEKTCIPGIYDEAEKMMVEVSKKIGITKKEADVATAILILEGIEQKCELIDNSSLCLGRKRQVYESIMLIMQP